jgi:hypothetical protein
MGSPPYCAYWLEAFLRGGPAQQSHPASAGVQQCATYALAILAQHSCLGPARFYLTWIVELTRAERAEREGQCAFHTRVDLTSTSVA